MENATDGRGRIMGSGIGLFFGGVWSVLGARALSPGWQLPAAAAGIVLTAVLIFRLWRARLRPGAGPAMFRSRYYIAAVALELIALNVAGNLLLRSGLASYLLTSVGIIVGLHFIGLWLATRMRRFLWIAGAMCTVSTLAAFLPAASAGFNQRNVATGFANAVVLWIGASY